MQEIGLPCVVRPSFTLGGTGSSIAYNRDEFDELVQRGLDLSPIHQVLLEESVIGWKEYEMEVMRDADDNVVIICSIENFDPMGVHTGDSITVAPAQTLTDKEYQRMRDASLAVIREIGVDTGGSNIQFAVDPKDGRMVVIEMNPRVSRSSALASKATGFPIAKIAAKLAVGYRLHELANDITRETKACFEPTIDYVVVKVPRFAFEKFPEADPKLTTQMKSVGETMAIGRTFKEAFQKALRGLEVGSFGFGCDGKDLWGTPEQPSIDDLRSKLAVPGDQRVWYLRYAMKYGMSIDEIYDLTDIDPWFLDNLLEIVEMEEQLRQIGNLHQVDDATLRRAKQFGFSDRQLAVLWNTTEIDVRRHRKAHGIIATFKSVDTCAAEFEAYTPYYYSTYEDEDETPPKQPGKRRIVILGGGPNRIGQGIEFDYCCCHASFALRELGIESIMVNSNPETVSTDYDTSDLLFFEPLTTEDVLNICDRVQPDGVIVQFGGQTPLNLARALSNAGVPIIGTSVETIEDAEDREKFANFLRKLGLKQPPNGIARTMAQARSEMNKIGFPVLVRPSFVLGGRAMEICYDAAQFERFVTAAFIVSQGQPVLIDKFLEDAIEVDVDAIADGERVIVGGIMEHIEEAGVHSGDSACVLPPHSLPKAVIEEIHESTCKMATLLQRPRADERAVRRQARGRPASGLRARGQSPREPHGAVRLESHRHALGQGGRQGDGRRVAGRTRLHGRSGADKLLGEGGGFPVPQIRGRGCGAGAGDEIDGRGDGHLRPHAHRVRQEPTGRRHGLARARQDLHQRGRSREGEHRRIGQDARRTGLYAHRHQGHGDYSRSRRREGAGHQEAPGRASELARLDDRRRLAACHQHAARQRRPHRRRPHPRRGGAARHPLHHHAPGCRRRRPRHARAKERRNDRRSGAGPVSAVSQEQITLSDAVCESRRD